MKYRTFGKTGEELSVLGLDTLKLPNFKNTDRNRETNEILSHAIENGINIIDTAYSYYSFKDYENGSSEKYIGDFLDENSYRNEVFISTKLPSHLIASEKNMHEIFEKQLENLKTDHIDFYQLQNLNEKYWNMYKENGGLEFMDDLIADGRVKHMGFSSNTEMDMIVDITDDYDKWEFAETELSYITERYQSGLQGVEYMSSLGLGMMIREPLKGGALINSLPNEAKELWELIDEKRTPLELAFDYLFDKREVNTVLVGSENLSQMKQLIEIASNSDADCLSPDSRDLIHEIVWELREMRGNDCTECTHCLPCPQGVNIPAVFREYNIAKPLNNPNACALQYFTLEDGTRADSCIHCEECHRFCTQMIDISKNMEEIEEFFKTAKGF